MDKVIEKIILQAKKDAKVIAVALFGSYARGEPHRDIDVCIFLKPGKYSPSELFDRRLKFTPPEDRYDIQLFQQLPLYIQKRILKEGKIIYCKEEDALYDLCFATLRDYVHYQPIYESYLQAVANG